MKYVPLNQNFSVDREKNPITPSDRDLTLDWMANAIGYGYKGGLNGVDRILFAAVLEKIEAVKKTDKEYFEMNPVEELFIKKAFAQLTCSLQEAKWITIAEDAVNEATDVAPE